MKKNTFCLLVLSLVSISANAVSTQNLQQSHAKPTFNEINISSGINVYIDGSAKKSAIEIKGDPISVPYAAVSIKNNTLYIGMRPDYNVKNGRLSVWVHAPDLTRLSYDGSGEVTAENLHGALNLSINGKGPVKLKGMMNIQNLAYSGSGLLEIYWVNSKQLKITGNGSGKVYLAGTADFVEASLSEHTWLDAKQLRATKFFIKTTNNARADVWARDNLTTLAEDRSNIFFYHDASFIGGYMKPPAAVLRMTGINTN